MGASTYLCVELLQERTRIVDYLREVVLLFLLLFFIVVPMLAIQLIVTPATLFKTLKLVVRVFACPSTARSRRRSSYAPMLASMSRRCGLLFICVLRFWLLLDHVLPALNTLRRPDLHGAGRYCLLVGRGWNERRIVGRLGLSETRIHGSYGSGQL